MPISCTCLDKSDKCGDIDVQDLRGGGGNVVPAEGVGVGAWVPGEGVFKNSITQVTTNQR